MNEVEGQNQSWYVPTAMWGLFLLIALLILYPFLDTIQDMVHRWDTKEEYSYGYIIPFITLFFVWQHKDRLSEHEFKPTLWAVPLLFISGVIFFVGAVSTTHTLSQYALVLTILSLAYGVLGWKAFKIIAIPLAILFFMVPLPSFLYNNLSGKLQLISSELGVAVIRLFDISVYLEGNVIDLGEFKLQVVEACSGLRYLFPLMSLSFVAAYIYNVETWKRVVVFLSSIPITVFMNSFRIGVIGVLVEFYGIDQAEGFLHDFEGWIIFMACMSILFIEMTILAKIGKNKRSLADVFAIDLPEPRDTSNGRKRSINGVHYSLVFILALYSVSTFYMLERDNVVLDRKSFSSFPEEIQGWKGYKQKLGPKILEALNADDYVIVDYGNDNGEQVNFYVAYYESQEAGSAAHSPRACIPGGGWKIDNLSEIVLDNISVAGQLVRANRLLIKQGEHGQLVYYWFQQRGRVITNEYLVKWYLFWDALTRNRTDGSLVRLTTYIKPGEDIALADKRLLDFANLTQPYLSDYVPE